ncbi:MAG: pyridoxal 5'-phosphate synthase glutaminase subunit PdxT [Ilumatobacteraceae bacterium]
MNPVVGVLALQGAFAAHEAALRGLGVATRQVRTLADLAQVTALVMPGGESTTMSRLLETSLMFEGLKERIAAGMPVFGTCAGMILLAEEVIDGRSDQRSFAAIDIRVRRNGYGRQVDSFETDIAVDGLDRPFHAVFIRAPKVEAVGSAVQVLATHDDVPVLARQAHVMVASFHPEITPDARLHEMFLQHNGFTTKRERG